MNRKIALGVLFILAIFTSATFINLASAESAPQLSTTIVISQAYGGGGATAGTPTYKHDYVELFNLSAAPQSLDGLSLMYGSGTGNFGSTAGNIVALPMGVTLQPGQHYLVQLGTAGTVGADLPTPDFVSPNITAAAGNGKFALTNGLMPNSCGATATPCALPNAQIIDLISYGTANNAEGGAAVAALTNMTSAVRNNNGCSETDNNAADFTIVTNAVPRNLSSPATPCGAPPAATPDVNVDFNGDGRSDYVVTRNDSGSKTWFTNINGGGFSAAQFGIASDTEVPEDYDGDGKDDIAVWRSGSPAAFYIMQSGTNTVRTAAFGIPGDDPRVVADYDGDNKADIAVYRKNTAGQNFYYYQSSISGNLVSTPWGAGATPRPNVGDYDGDNKADFCVQYDGGSGQGIFAVQKSAGGVEYIVFGLTSDRLVPGDFDGDGKADFTVVRNTANGLAWYTLTRTNQNSSALFGLSTDQLAPGDYDGDGRQDIAVWRPGSPSVFYSRRSTNGSLQAFGFGITSDFPAANWYTH